MVRGADVRQGTMEDMLRDPAQGSKTVWGETDCPEKQMFEKTE